MKVEASAAGRNRKRWVFVVLLLIGFAVVVPVQEGIDHRRGREDKFADVLYVPSGRLLQSLSLGHEGLLADIYWTRVVQYFGRKRLAGDQHFDLLGPLLRITTELDPHLLIAYRFGAIFLAEKPPGGAGKPEQALELLRRGIVANPGYWRLWEDLGFIDYWDVKDYRSAARAFQIGSERPGAMPSMKALAATVAAQGGELRTSELLWSEIYRSADNDQLRKTAGDHLVALHAQDQMRKLDLQIDRYREREGHRARSFQDLVAAGLLSAVPRDPYGAPYIVGPKGHAMLSPSSGVDLRLLQ